MLVTNVQAEPDNGQNDKIYYLKLQKYCTVVKMMESTASSPVLYQCIMVEQPV